MKPADDMARLHPLSPLLRALRSTWFIIAAISWQGFQRLGLTRGAMVIAGITVAGLVWSWVGWYVTGYRIADGELRIADGILTRSRRSIPIARLQAVDVVRPFLARVCGLAELRLEVAGGGRTEAPLSYLTVGDARRLRRELLAMAAVDTTPAPATGNGETAHILVSVPTRRLVAAQLATPQILLLPVALTVTIWLFTIDPDLSLIGMAGLLTAVAGILFQPVKEALVNYAFTARVTTDGLRVVHGLFEQRHQTLPLRRVVAASVRSPWLWRPTRWVRANVASAAYANGGGHEGYAGRTLLPVGFRADAVRVIGEVLPGVDPDEITYTPVPARARWVALWWRRGYGVAVTDRVYAVRSGWLTHTEVFIPYERVQGVRVTQGRWQRVFALASVRVDLAGVTMMPTVAAHRDVSEALKLAKDLIRRARPAPERD